MDMIQNNVNMSGSKVRFKPTLLQTFYATVSSLTFATTANPDSRYIEPNRAIVFSHPIILGPKDPAFFLQEQGYLFYGGNYFYCRCIDGTLIERGDEAQTDYATETDLDILSAYSRQWPSVDVLIVDQMKNFYYQNVDDLHNILVCSPDGLLQGKFHIVGFPQLWYLTDEGKVCILTSNGASDPGKKKNILRLYRLDLPETISRKS